MRVVGRPHFIFYFIDETLKSVDGCCLMDPVGLMRVSSGFSAKVLFGLRVHLLPAQNLVGLRPFFFDEFRFFW
jgi:hypothetical protein